MINCRCIFKWPSMYRVETIPMKIWFVKKINEKTKTFYIKVTCGHFYFRQLRIKHYLVGNRCFLPHYRSYKVLQSIQAISENRGSHNITRTLPLFPGSVFTPRCVCSFTCQWSANNWQGKSLKKMLNLWQIYVLIKKWHATALNCLID